MRTGLITDVHGNLPALEVVLDRLRRAGIDRLVCLGDVVGYGAQPDECVSIVREHAVECVLGNHDAAVSGRVRFEYARAEGRMLVDFATSVLSASNKAWLRARPLIAHDGDVAFCHGAPLRPQEFHYVLSLGQATALTAGWDELRRITFIGHSHVERSYRLWPGGATELLTGRLRIVPGFRYVVNVGSVGQPRDRDPRAAAAIYDDRQEAVEFYRVPYDIETAASRIRAAGIPEVFAQRLYAGW